MKKMKLNEEEKKALANNSPQEFKKNETRDPLRGKSKDP
tara:strand:- start:48 stop:164 length:117 start_codon:yes stop_codon:yes gene_type:complete